MATDSGGELRTQHRRIYLLMARQTKGRFKNPKQNPTNITTAILYKFHNTLKL